MVLAEKALIAQLRRSAKSSKNSAVALGIADDCAILRLSPKRGELQDDLVTTDFSLEGIHFRRDWHSPESVGHRCLARGLSDIAAMGGQPVAAFLSLALPPDLSQTWVNRFTRGLLKLANRYNVTLAGGDTAQSPNGILADIIVVGSVPKGKSLLRSTARAGDLIYITGELGASAAALNALRNSSKKLNPLHYSRHFFPEPRVALGLFLRKKNLASAMIDTSDGLSTDLAHICEESSVGAEIHAELIPRARVGHPPRLVDLNSGLHAGEDYELLFTAPKNKPIPSRVAGIPITRIGRITRARKMILTDPNGIRHPLKPQGWEHFRR